MTKIIGRIKEMAQLEAAYHNDESQFVVVYGRRRIGKTFLVRENFEGRMTFYATGVNKESRNVQLQYFHYALTRYFNTPIPFPQSWQEAFSALIRLLEGTEAEKKVIFLDELSWMNGNDSSFLTALEWFWNSWASARKDVLLICCSSATSWIINKVFNNHGGLYGRVNLRIHLHAFTLKESEEYFAQHSIAMNRYDQAICHMVLGGVPYYLSLLDSNLSLPQNIDNLFFNPDGQLHHEYENLYHAMFRNASNHLLVVDAIATKRKGMTRKEILEATKLPNAGSTSRVLDELEQSDFIRRYTSFGQKKRDEIYQLTDAYSLFYFHFLKGNTNNDSEFWQHHLGSASLNSWKGYAFEQVCLSHTEQIKRALGISGISVSTSAWVSKSQERKSQIDLVLDRADNIVDLCEIKFSNSPFTITKAYADLMQQRVWQFAEETKTRKNCQLVMITSYGMKKNQHSSIVQRELMLDDLFC